MPCSRSMNTLEDAFATAAKNAFAAGFDGVEIYGAPRRPNYPGREQPAYGRSTVALSKTVPNLRLRSSTNWPLPSATRRSVSDFHRFTIPVYVMEDPYPQFSYIVSKLQKNHPKLAYIHMIEPRVSGGTDREPRGDESTDPYQ
ncbi:hypothetical protein V1508DRAFT_276818 [Lipomyces doorenjongii]|uniref:uncharacterized protein n=1 Tax=Lipomyces doorenjongii TaxID=383834 RepID=UPI0034CFAC2B